jgi:PAS domain S-box-containing protein
MHFLDPQKHVVAGRILLPDIIGVTSADRFNREVMPKVRVLRTWAGVIDLRNAMGTEYRTHITLQESRGVWETLGNYITLYADLPESADSSKSENKLSDGDLLNALLESVPDSVYFKDAASRFLRISRAQAAKFGIADPREAIGRTDFDFFTIAHAAPAFEDEQNILKTGRPVIDLEEKETFEDGNTTWVSTTKLPFRNQDGQLIGTFGISRDITVRKQAEEALRESESRFRSIFEGAHDAIMLFADGHFFDCNQKTLEMFCCTKEAFVRMSPGDISPPLQPDGRGSVAAAMEHNDEVLSHGSCRFEWMHRRLDGTDFPAEVLLSAFDLCGKRVVQAAVRDITERKRHDEEKSEMETRLQLGQKLESVGRLAAGVAHEINTPTQYISDNMRFLITAVAQLKRTLESHRSLVDAASNCPECASAVEAVRVAETDNDIAYILGEIPRTLDQSIEGLNRISRIVSSLKEFSHPGGSDKSSADLNRAIETAIAVSRHEWKYVAEVATEFDPQLPSVLCVLDEINQAVLNLIINAAHAVGDANTRLGRKIGRIVVRTRQEKGWVIIEVEDTGTGIPPEIQHRIFEPFFTTKGIGKGTGQGLYIVRNVIMKGHGGRVDFTTEPGHGTIFRICLPLEVAPIAPSDSTSTVATAL